MNASYLLPVILLLVFGGYAALRMSKMSGAVAASGPAVHAFMQRTGYRYSGMPPEPLEAHVQRALADMQTLATKGGERHCVRNVQGAAVQWTEGSAITQDGYAVWSEWSAPRTQPARVLFHIADRSLSGLGRAVGELLSNVRSSWTPRYPNAVQTGIPQLDGRFVVFGQDPGAVHAYFHHNPALVAMLLQCAQVDLWTDPQRAAFADPMQKNMMAALGGTAGQMAMGFDIGKRLELSIPVHDRIAEMLVTTVRTS